LQRFLRGLEGDDATDAWIDLEHLPGDMLNENLEGHVKPRGDVLQRHGLASVEIGANGSAPVSETGAREVLVSDQH
jgi:hypothetical protein